MSLPSVRSMMALLLLSRFRVPRDAARFAFRRYRDRVALITSTGQWTYAQLADRVYRLADSLAERGVRPGDTVFMMLPDGNEQVEVVLALAELGAIRGAFHGHHEEDMIVEVARDTSAKVFIYDETLGGRVRARFAEQLPDLFCLRVGPDGDYEKMIAGGRPRRNTQSIVPSDPAMLGFTSGTTGTPKGVITTGEKLLLNLKLVVANMRGPRGDGDLMIAGVPLGGAGSYFILPMLLSGSTLVVPTDYQMSTLLPLIQRMKVTRLFVSPSLLIDMLDTPDLDKYDLSSLRNVIYGSAPMPARKLAEAVRRFGPIFQQGYGMSEVLAPITMLHMDQHVVGDEPAPEEVLNSVGHVIPQVKVRVVDPQERDLPTGEIGQLLVDSPLTFAGYWGRPDLTRQVLRDGWMRTGDYGYFDSDGRLHVLDRAADLIEVDGRTVYPRLVEEICHAHPGVKEVCMVQVDADAPGRSEEIVLCLSPRRVRPDGQPTSSEDVLVKEVRELLTDRAESWQLPDRIVVMPELPRSFLRKVLRREVREMLADR